MTHGSLYSGIGGWLLAARWAEIENIFTVEIDEFCNKVLKKHFKVEQYRDIKEFNGTKYRGTIDIISTSDPCQPFSFAGKRGGKTDDRFLWPQTIRIIREIRPSYVVCENVSGFISMAFETIASDLEAEGYAVESFIIPACAVGAWHRRDRLWVVAYSNSITGKIGGDDRTDETKGVRRGNKPRGSGTNDRGKFGTSENEKDVSDTEIQYKGRLSERKEKEQSRFTISSKNVPNPKYHGSYEAGDKWKLQGEFDWAQKNFKQFTGPGQWTTEPNVGRVAHGIPNRIHRLKSLGNSIVPQIAYIIFEAIKQYEINRNDT